jgi:tight adherence protein B
MNGGPSSIMTLVQAGAAFGLVLALWSVAVLAWSKKKHGEQQAIARRLGTAAEEPASRGTRVLRLWHEGREARLRVPGLRQKPDFRTRFARLCRDAGLAAPPRTVGLALAGSALFVGVLLLLVTGRAFPALVGMLALVLAFWAWINKRAVKQARLLERQLVDALELSARALRAGHPLMASFQLIATEIPAPVGTLFAGIVQQQSMGMALDESLRRAAADGGSVDMDLFAAALSIHTRTGGNLADVMQSLALVIRERMRLGRRFRVLVAQTQVSKRILIAMPCVMFGVLHLVSAEYMEGLYADSTGQMVLMAAAGSLICGWAVMNRMAELRT